MIVRNNLLPSVHSSRAPARPRPKIKFHKFFDFSSFLLGRRQLQPVDGTFQNRTLNVVYLFFSI
jgi:hypothetical protein